MQAIKIPATIITGFLGVGKTTMVQHIVENSGNKRLALIINEFGDLGIDGDFLQKCKNPNCQDIIELSNGCICCTVADDFIPTMEKLLNEKNKPEHIIIETSGLALPQPLVNAFNWHEIKQQVKVDGVITLIDSAAVYEGRFADDEKAIDRQRKQDESLSHESPLSELFHDQISSADLIVLTKTDLLAKDKLQEVETKIKNIKNVPLIYSSQNKKPNNEIMLGVYEREMQTAHDHEHEHEHDHDDFATFVVEGGEIENVENFINELKKIISANDILRLKGFVAVKNKPMRLAVQAVGARIDNYFDKNWQSDEKKISRLVVIGDSHWQQEKLQKQIQSSIQNC